MKRLLALSLITVLLNGCVLLSVGSRGPAKDPLKKEKPDAVPAPAPASSLPRQAVV